MYALPVKGVLICFDTYAKHWDSSVHHARAADFCQLAASKGKECDGQPPQYV